MTVSTIFVTKKFQAFFLMICVCCFVAHAQDISIIPIPVSQQNGSGSFEITTSTNIAVPAKQPELQKIAAYLAEKLKPATGIAVKTSDSPSGSSAIQFVLTSKPDTMIGQEGYSLEISTSKVLITA